MREHVETKTQAEATAKKDAKAKTQAQAVAATWNDKAVRLARSTQHEVTVNGEGPFRSVAAAFKHFKLPFAQHIKFRKEVKAKGSAKFEDGKKTFTFKIVKE